MQLLLRSGVMDLWWPGGILITAATVVLLLGFGVLYFNTLYGSGFLL